MIKKFIGRTIGKAASFAKKTGIKVLKNQQGQLRQTQMVPLTQLIGVCLCRCHRE